MAEAKLTLPYAPRDAFLPYHYRTQRWAVLVAHRRAGKTVACVNDLIKAAILEAKPDGRYAYIAPLYVQAKDVAWIYLKRYAGPLLASPPNESELRVDLINGARIRLYGADNPDRLRGLYFDGVVMDEAADMHPGVFPEVVLPALADRNGWATFIGTPKGRNSFFDTLEYARDHPAEWFSGVLRSSETGILSADQLEVQRSQQTPEQYEQEFECSFDAAIIGAYYGRDIAQAERDKRICEVPYEPSLPVHTAWDLGVGDATAIWFFQVLGKTVRVIDHYEATGRGLQHFADELASRPYKYGDDFVPHDAKVREFTSGSIPRTRVQAMTALGRKPRLVPNHKIEDGINAVRVTFPRLWIDAERCKTGIEALRQYRTEYDDKARVFRDRPKHDWTSHSADAFRYLCMAWREMAAVPADAPKPKVLGVGSHNTVTFNDLIKL